MDSIQTQHQAYTMQFERYVQPFGAVKRLQQLVGGAAGCERGGAAVLPLPPKRPEGGAGSGPREERSAAT